MPVPKPKGNESQNTFMGRCMSWAKDEFDDQDQRVAVCMTSWRGGKGQKALKGEALNKAVQKYQFTEKMKQIHMFLTKQLASFKTSVNGEDLHYHYFEVDSSGNGSTVITISTEDPPTQVEDHEHNISKWEVRSIQSHTHALDKVVKVKRGRPIKKKYKCPSRDTFKDFADFDKAMKDYLGRSSKSRMAPSTHLAKSYLTKVMKRVLSTYVEKQGLPVEEAPRVKEPEGEEREGRSSQSEILYQSLMEFKYFVGKTGKQKRFKGGYRGCMTYQTKKGLNSQNAGNLCSFISRQSR